MHIGIFVHSLTGNTLYVANQLRDKLLTEGYSVKIEKIEIDGKEDAKVIDPSKIKLKRNPDYKSYDLIIFGAPVRGGNISPALLSYLATVKAFENRKALCFVTQFFPFPWMGGKKAIMQMKGLCESKGARVLGTGIVNWKHKQREQKIEELVNSFTELF